MNRTNEIYKKWLDKLITIQPVLDKPEELTNDILNRINALPSKREKNPILMLVSKISGIAATLLLCFLASETIFFSQDGQSQELSHVKNLVWLRKSAPLPDGWDKESSFMEKSNFLSEQWKEYRKERSARKALFLSKGIATETITYKNE